MEPITMIVTAFALGAAEGIKDSASQVVKDGYDALKRVIQDRYKNNRDVTDAIDSVSKRPELKNRQSELVQALEAANADEDRELIELSRQLLEITRKDSDSESSRAIGLDLGDNAEAKRVKVSDIGEGGTGVRAKGRSKIGDCEISGVKSK